ncbi:hypothetical protein DICVIV_11629 [Dictyocaulus viviparus]|uniref:Fumarylacetoacetase-like C-terminal domain-containing protein n=1 Tax=Dictyocaulus viviparus TaxID=29172 RepID=A0A0D8XJ95_DICVI|nr:hypothetical protein DICVIV_11629 [Dictyocaulus viviparus]
MSLAAFRLMATKIVCVGRNYKDHALELGNPIPKKPVLFLKITGVPVVRLMKLNKSRLVGFNRRVYRSSFVGIKCPGHLIIVSLECSAISIIFDR